MWRAHYREHVLSELNDSGGRGPGLFFPRREPRAKWPRAVRIRRPANRTSVLGALERDNHIHKQNREGEGTISNTHA